MIKKLVRVFIAISACSIFVFGVYALLQTRENVDHQKHVLDHEMKVFDSLKTTFHANQDTIYVLYGKLYHNAWIAGANAAIHISDEGVGGTFRAMILYKRCTIDSLKTFKRND